MMRLNLTMFGSAEAEQMNTDAIRDYPLMTLTVQQMAKAMNISRNTAYELVKQPGFPCFHIGKRILVNRDMLQLWLNDQCCQPA